MRKKDALRGADELADVDLGQHDSIGTGMDLDSALATLPDPVRMCVVLSYHEGMSHGEIAEAMDLPLGTTKSHINRGTQRLQQILAAYSDGSNVEES